MFRSSNGTKVACTNCHNHKKKCIRFNNEKCVRCFNSGEKCYPHESKQGQRCGANAIRSTKNDCTDSFEGEVARGYLQLDVALPSPKILECASLEVPEKNFNTNGNLELEECKGSIEKKLTTKDEECLDSRVGGKKKPPCPVGFRSLPPSEKEVLGGKTTKAKIKHFGLDFGGHGAGSISITSELDDDGTPFTTLAGTSRGTRSIFTFNNQSKYLNEWRTCDRVAVEDGSKVAFIECSSLVNFEQGCNGSLAVFSTLEAPEKKLFAIVSSFYYLPKFVKKGGSQLGEAHLYEWIGEVDGDGIPVAFGLTSWEAISKHFQLKAYDLEKINLQFVNQISGPCPMDLSLDPAVKNASDGGVQSSPLGPDFWPVPVPTSDSSGASNKNHLSSCNFFEHKVTPEITGHPDLLVANPSLRKQSRRKKKAKPYEALTPEGSCSIQESIVARWMKPPKKIPNSDHSGLVAVVQKDDGSSIGLADTTELGVSGKGQFLLPLSSSATDTGLVKEFHCCSVDDIANLMDECERQDGFDVGEVDKFISDCSIEQSSLVCLQNAKPPPNCNYHGFVRVFGGDCSPPLDDSFSKINVPSTNLSVCYKFCPARYYTEFVPLSLALFQSILH